jgi:predicted GIY-YIG superfamily endonuclease
MKTEYIYYLICPITDEVKYVGKTANPKARYKTHINKLDKTNTPKRQWLESLFKKSLLPGFKIVEQHQDPEIARNHEQKHLDLHSKTALNIHNPKKGSKSVKWEGHDWNFNKKNDEI